MPKLLSAFVGIHAISEEEAEEIKKTADHVAKLNKARDQFLNTSKKISDAQFNRAFPPD